MELLLDYEYSCIFILLFPKFSHGFLIKVYYSLSLSTLPVCVHVIIKLYF